jgi:hypothetical protein
MISTSSTDSAERRALVAALTDLLAQRTGDQVPASAIRQLIAELEHGPQRDDRAR